jgi:hypothetical protein
MIEQRNFEVTNHFDLRLMETEIGMDILKQDFC